jgi:hypothetical protein
MAFYAAMTNVDLREIAVRIQRNLSLPEFHCDVETEGDDWWEYAVFDGPPLINLTKVGSFNNPSLWRWMWGVPASANFQLIVQHAGADLERIEEAVSAALECPLVPYPSNFSASDKR